MKPQALKKKPKLRTRDEYLYAKFWELNRSRHVGEIVGHIPEEAYLSHWLAEGVTGVEERAYYKRMVTILDDAFVAHMMEKRKKEVEKAKSQAGGSRGMPAVR